jgi:hypothetical protein
VVKSATNPDGWLEHIKSVHDAERNLVTLKEFGADGTNRKKII